jgi:hypothetical protein
LLTAQAFSTIAMATSLNESNLDHGGITSNNTDPVHDTQEPFHLAGKWYIISNYEGRFAIHEVQRPSIASDAPTPNKTPRKRIRKSKKGSTFRFSWELIVNAERRGESITITCLWKPSTDGVVCKQVFGDLESAHVRTYLCNPILPIAMKVAYIE